MSFGGILMGIFMPHGQPGSFYDLAQQSQKYQPGLWQYAQQIGTVPSQILKYNDQSIDKREHPEFQWLRNRVNEILWR